MPFVANAPNDWPAVPVTSMRDVPSGSPARAEATRDLAREHRAERAMRVRDAEADGHALARSSAGRAHSMSVRSATCAIAVVLVDACDAARRPASGRFEHAPEVERCAPSGERCPRDVTTQSIAPDHLVDGAEAERRHDAAQLLGDEEHVVHDVLGRAREARAEHRVLRRDADGARVEVALAHHDAAARDERRGGEAELLGAEERGERDVAPGLELAVDLER